MSERTTKSTIRPVLPAKTPISLYIHPVWQGFSIIPLCIKKTHLFKYIENFSPKKLKNFR